MLSQEVNYVKSEYIIFDHLLSKRKENIIIALSWRDSPCFPQQNK